MKTITTFIILYLFISCDQSVSSTKADNPVTDSSALNDSAISSQPGSPVIKSKEKIVITPTREIDTILLMNVSEEILKHIKTRNYRKLSSFIYLQDRLRFSPYAYIDTTKDLVLSADRLLLLAKQNKKINWNSSREEEKPELLTIDGYFKKFVYDVNFLNAELKSVNHFHSQGTDLNNIIEAYPGCDVVEFFFSGFDKKYGGHDFRGLRLVYKTKNNKPWLVGIVHDEWTP